MCSLFAAIQFAEPFTEEKIEALKKANDITAYRGPDASSSQLFQNPDHTSIFLGHRRLSIIDLSADGNQPMESNGIWIIFNGEIFNYIELRQELQNKGHEFKSKSDTEVILKIYEALGVSGFSKLNGMWSFVIYDSIKRIVIASRDRFSIKPLYYLKHQDGFYFSSEIKQLLPFLERKRINESVVKIFLLQGIQDHTQETFFKDIVKVPSASTLTINLTDQKIVRNVYWSFSKSQENLNEGDAIEKLQHLLKKSIQLRLRSDVSLGSLLSGGLDSSAITEYASELSQHALQTYSVISANPAYSEENFIDILIRERGFLNKKFLFNPTTAINSIDECLYHQDEPFSVASVVAQFMIYQLIKKETEIKVVLSGQGGDEVLMGYLKYFFFNITNLLNEKKYFAAGAEIFYSILHRTAIMQFEAGKAKRYLPSSLRKKINYINNPDSLEKIWQANDLHDRQIADIDFYSVPALTHYEDRNSMAHSIESRAPFLDHELVDFLVSLPASHKYKNGWSKYLLRKAATNLPESIRWRRDKKSFSLPEKEWLFNDLRPEVNDLVRSSVLMEKGLINRRELKLYIEQFYKSKPGTDSKEIFSLLICERWAKQNFN